MNAAGEPMPEVYTRRLQLRLPRVADAPDIARLMTPGISARLASWPMQMSVEDATLRIEDALSDHAAGVALPLLMCCRGSDEVLGWIAGRRNAHVPSLASFTYWIGEAFHGQGLMREAAPAALAEVFARLGVDRVQAAVQSDNAQSRGVLRALGMRVQELGQIWCPARQRHEDCEWWAVESPAAWREHGLAATPARVQPLSPRIAAAG